MKKRKRDDLFSVPRGITIVPLKPGAWPSPEEYAEAIKKQSSADSKILHVLMQAYERHSTSKIALQSFWNTVHSLFENGLLSSDEAECLQQAASGDFGAAQILVQKNPDVLRLPFIQDTIIAFLNNYKYSMTVSLPTEKDRWSGFLVKRPKKKVMFHKENIRNLYAINAASKKKYDTYTTEKTADMLDIKQSTVSKTIAVKGKRGRPKKSK